MNPGTQFAVISATAIAGVSAAVAYGMRAPQSQLFGPTLVAPPDPNQVALTFDDGPNPAATPRLLEVLARRNVRATFFLIGDFVLREPALAREIAAAGHAIGNHTMTHPFLPWRSERDIREQIDGCNQVLEDTLGCRIELFRPPHGARRPAVLRIARELGLKTVQWNVMVGDWNDISSATILDRLERGIAGNRSRRRGSNLVLHDGGQAGLNQPRLRSVGAVELLLQKLPPETRFVTPPDWN